MDSTSLDLNKIERIEIQPIFQLRYSYFASLFFVYVTYLSYNAYDRAEFEWVFWFLLVSTLSCIYYTFTANHGLVFKKDKIYLIRYYPFSYKIQNLFPGNNLIFSFKNFRHSSKTDGKNYIYKINAILNNKVYSFDFATYVMRFYLSDNESYLNSNLVLNNPEHNQIFFNFLNLYYPQVNVSEYKK